MDLHGLIGQQIGKYRLTQLLGRGGMAAVYRGEHTMLAGNVKAIKVILPQFARDTTFRQRFLQEGAVLHKLKHPHIVAFHDLDQLTLPNGEPVLVMELELLEGEPLDARIVREGALPPHEAVRIVREASEGIAFAHGLGIQHRDIKPANLYLAGASRTVKVLDFGIAKVKEETDRENPGLTKTSGPPGTPAYMAPESFRAGTKPDTRLDVYALGLTLYECLLGKHPFVAAGIEITSEWQWPTLHVAQALPPVPNAPAELAQVLARATAKDPEQRYPSAVELARALAEIEARMPRTGAPHAPAAGFESLVAVPSGGFYATPVARTPAPKSSGAPKAVGNRALVAFGAVAVIAGGGAAAYFTLAAPAGRQPPPVVPVGVSPPGPPNTVQIPDDPMRGAVQAIGNRGSRPAACPRFFEGDANGACLPTGMIVVPAGAVPVADDGRPVTVPTFYLDRTEVTVGAYRACAAEAPQSCTPVGTADGCNPLEALYDSHPVNCVSYEQARAFCTYRGARLATVAEWELAARGDGGERKYPWGSGDPGEDDSLRWMIQAATPLTAPAGTSLRDRTPLGILDLAANLAEWVAPMSGDAQAHKGGSFRSATPTVVASAFPARAEDVGTVRPTIGFRCALTPP